MTRIDKAFVALSHRMDSLSAPSRTPTSSEPIASLLARVDAAKMRYQPASR